jgi:hypothetical protein
MSDQEHKSLTNISIKTTEHILEATINAKPCTINAFFSMVHLEQYFELVNQQKGYRAAFAEISYEMFTKTKKSDTLTEDTLALSDFVAATDDELLQILNAILYADSAVKVEYDNLEVDDPYERFFFANKNIIEHSTERTAQASKTRGSTYEHVISPSTRKVIEQASKIVSVAQLPKIDKGLANFSSNYVHLTHKICPPELINYQHLLQSTSLLPSAETLTRITSVIANSGIIDALQSFPNPIHTVNNMTASLKAVFEGIPKIQFDFAASLQPLIDAAQAESQRAINALKSTVSVFGKALSNIDFSLLSRYDEWDERHDAMLAYGWFYLNELPEDIIEHIWQKRGELSQEEVDSIIVAFFRKDRCAALKRITKKWKSLRYFQSRSVVFHEALVNHSRRCFNSSTTMLTLHIEGVICDFVRLSLKCPKFRTIRALLDIKSCMNNSSYLSLTSSDWQIFEEIIIRIQAAISEGFDHANPDTASNESRDKIAHGHAVDKETEVSSLKRFLYLNELYRLFEALDIALAAAQT